MRRLPPFRINIALIVLLSACAPKPVSTLPPPPAPVVNAVWTDAISKAKRDPSYAGAYVANGILWLGFTSKAETKASTIANQPDVRGYTADHNEADLDKAFKATVDLLVISRYGPTSANIDYRLGIISISSAYSLQGSGGPIPKCSELPAIPATAPGTTVKLIDGRDCTK